MEKKLESITWKTFRPDSFPCIVCGEDEAVYIRIEDDFHLPVCPRCAQRPWGEIIEAIKLKP